MISLNPFILFKYIGTLLWYPLRRASIIYGNIKLRGKTDWPTSWGWNRKSTDPSGEVGENRLTHLVRWEKEIGWPIWWDGRKKSVDPSGEVGENRLTHLVRWEKEIGWPIWWDGRKKSVDPSGEMGERNRLTHLVRWEKEIGWPIWWGVRRKLVHLLVRWDHRLAQLLE